MLILRLVVPRPRRLRVLALYSTLWSVGLTARRCSCSLPTATVSCGAAPDGSRHPSVENHVTPRPDSGNSQWPRLSGARFPEPRVGRLCCGAGCTSTRIPLTSGSRFRTHTSNRGSSCRSLAATAALSAERTSVPARKLLTRVASDSARGTASKISRSKSARRRASRDSVFSCPDPASSSPILCVAMGISGGRR